MRFERIRVQHYGRLHEFESGALSDFTVFHGQNEAGKSTLFRFLGTILFGFSPVDPNNHPDAPWSGGELSGEAEILLDDGTELRLQRSLRGKPGGGFETNGRFEELQNRPLPAVDAIGRKVFDSIYALTLARLRQIDARMWERVLEQLLTGFGASDLGSVRDSIETFEKDGNRLWRPDRRGKPVAAHAKAKLKELRLRRTEARAREDRQRELHDRRDAAAAQIGTAEQALAATRSELQRLQRLAPFAPRFVQLDLLQQASAAAPKIPASRLDPQHRWDEANDEWDELHSQIERREARLQHLASCAEEFDATARQVLEQRDAIAAAEDALQQTIALRRDEARHEADLERAEHELQEAGAKLSDEAPSDEDWAHLAALDLDAHALELKGVQNATSTVHELRQQLRELDILVQRDTSGAPPLALWLCGVGTVAFGGLYAALESGVLGGFALMLTIITFVVGVRWWRERQRLGGNNPRQRRNDQHGVLRDAETKLTQAQDTVAARLGPFARKEPLTIPELQRLQGLLRERQKAAEVVQANSDVLSACQQAIREHLEPLDCWDAEQAPEATLAQIRGRLRQADERRIRAEVSAEEQKHLNDELVDLRAKRSDLGAVRGELEETFIEFGDGDLQRGLQVVAQQWAADRRAAQLEEDLRAECTDYSAVRDEILVAHEKGESWVSDPKAREVLQKRADEQEAHLTQLRQQVRDADRQLEDSLREESLASVEARIVDVETQVRECEHGRDRKHLLASVLREAERRFRASHQDDILRRAGDYLARVTEGRYEKLLARGNEHGPELLLFDKTSRREIPITEPLSQGARDQVYFALRLAIADHLDQDGERLPLLVDESFVNWDLERRRLGIELLRDVATRRQVFFFTFDPASHGLEDEHVIAVTARSGEFAG